MTIMLDEVKEFPLLRDSAAYLFIKITLQDTDTTFSEKETYALIELPRSIDRFVVLPTKGKRKYIILLDDLIRFNLAFHFNIFNYESFTAHMIKITRDAELDLETDLSKSFLEKVSASVKERRTGNPVRFVYDSTMDPKMLEFLIRKMKIDDTDSIIPGGKYHNRRDYMRFPNLEIKELMYQPQEPLNIPGLSLIGSVLEKIEKKDYLLYTPYQNFNYVVKFLRESAWIRRLNPLK